MKRNGYIALGLFILSLVIISYVGGPASYGFFFFTLFVLLVSFIYTIVVFARFKIYQSIESRTVTAGSATPFFFTLQNEDVFTHSGVRTHFFTDFSSITGLSDEEYELMPHTGIRRETILLCRYRGEYDVGIKSVTVTDYLRLFSITFKNRETIKAIVQPRLEMLPDSLRPESVLDPEGAENRDMKIPDIPVREYIPGDDIRFINWKATARTGKPQMRTFTGEVIPSLCIIMDPLRYSDDQGKYLPVENKILETVLALGYFFASHGMDVKVCTYSGKKMTFRVNAPEGFEEFYNAMAGFSFRKDNTHRAFFASCGSDENIADCSSVIYVFHEWSKEARLFSEGLAHYHVRQSLFLITDRQDGISSSGDSHLPVRQIGYEDRISEVLG